MVLSYASEEALAYRDNMLIKNEKKCYILIAKSLNSYIKYISSIFIYTYP